jgi:integrase
VREGASLSAATVRRVHAVVHSALEQGVAWDLLLFNPAAKASPGRIEASEMRILTVDEVLRMLKEAEPEDPDLAVFLILAAVTGPGVASCAHSGGTTSTSRLDR